MTNPFDVDMFSDDPENPFDSPTTPKHQNTMDRIRARVDEALGSSVGPSGTRIAANPLVRNIVEAPFRAASVVEDLVTTNPIRTMEAASEGVGEGIKGLASLVGGTAQQISEGQIAEAGKSVFNVIYEGMIRPLLAEPLEAGVGRSLRPSQFGKELTDVEAMAAGKDAVANWAGVFIGAHIGKSLSKAGIASTRIKSLADVKNLDDVFAKLPTLEAPAQMEIARALSDINLPARFRRGMLEGSTGGLATGLMIGDTQEERFQAAFNYGLAGALLGGTFEMGFGGIKNRKGVRNTALALASNEQANAIMGLPPKNAVKAASELLEGIPVDEVIYRNLPPDEVIVVRNLDQVSPTIQRLAERQRTPDNVTAMSEDQVNRAKAIITNKRTQEATRNIWLNYSEAEKVALIEKLKTTGRSYLSRSPITTSEIVQNINKAFKDGKENGNLQAISILQHLAKELDVNAIKAGITYEDVLNYHRVESPEAFTGPKVSGPVTIYKNALGKFDVLFDPLNIAESDISIDPVIRDKYLRLLEDGFSDFAAKVPTATALRLARKAVGEKTLAELIQAKLNLIAAYRGEALDPDRQIWFAEEIAREVVDASITGNKLVDYRTLVALGIDDFITPRDIKNIEMAAVIDVESSDAIHTYLYGKDWKRSVMQHWDALRASPNAEDRAFLTLIMDRLGITDMGEVSANLMTPGEGMPDNILGALANALADLRDAEGQGTSDLLSSLPTAPRTPASYLSHRLLKIVAMNAKGDEIARLNLIKAGKGIAKKAKFDRTKLTTAQILDLEYIFDDAARRVDEVGENISFTEAADIVRTTVTGNKFLKSSSEMLAVPLIRVLSTFGDWHKNLFESKGLIPEQIVMHNGRGYAVVGLSAEQLKNAIEVVRDPGVKDNINAFKANVKVLEAELRKRDNSPEDITRITDEINQLKEAIEIEETALKNTGKMLKGTKDGYVTLEDVMTGDLKVVKLKDIQLPSKLAIRKPKLTPDNELIEIVDVFGNIKEAHTLNLLNLKDNTASPTYPLFTEAEQILIGRNFEAQKSRHADIAGELGRRFTASDLLLQPQDGRIVVRSRLSGKVLGMADTIDDIIAMAPDLTGAYKAGKGGGGTILPPPNRMFFGESPAGGAPRSKWASRLDLFRITTYWAQPTQYFFKAIENIFPNAKVYTEFFRPAQEGLYKFQAARAPWIKLVADVSSNLLKGVDAARRVLLFDYLEAMTPDEIKAGRLARAMNSEEIGIAESFANILKTNGNADLSVKRVMRVRDMRARIRDIEGLSPARKQKLMDDFVASLDGGELSPNEIAFDELLSARKHTPNFSHYAITDLMSAILTDRKGRKDFAKIHNLTGSELGAAQAIEDIYKRLASVFGIKDARRINGYISHIRKYSDLGTVRVKELYPELNKIEQEFFANLPRVGNIVELNKDPIDVLLRYINAGFREQHLSSAMEGVRKTAAQAANEIANTKQKHSKLAGEALKRHTEAFLKEVNESSTDVEALTHAAYMEYMKAHGIAAADADNTLKAFLSAHNPLSSNALLKNIEFSAQGFRPIAGIRDLTAFTQIFAMRFGLSYLADGYKNFGTIWKNRKLLQELGETPGLSMTFAETAIEQATREALSATMGNVQMLPAAFDALREAGFKASLQPTVYELAHAFTYSIVKSRAIESLGKFMKKHISRDMLENEIHLDSYSPATIRKFNELFEAGRIEEAATFLAKDAGYEVVGHFGKANSPRLMWNQWGRVLGQFGQWPAWFLNVSGDLLTRGKGSTRAKNAAYIAASVGAFAAAQSVTGFNLQSWSMDPRNSMQYKGSPIWNMITAMVDLAASDYEPERNFAAATLEDLFNPNSGIMIPIPLQFRSTLTETIGRVDQEDPAWVIGWKLLGGSIDKEMYPKPLSMDGQGLKDKPVFGSIPNEGLPLIATIPDVSNDEFEAARVDETKPKLSLATLEALHPAKLMMYGALLGMLRKAPVKLGIELEVFPYLEGEALEAWRFLRDFRFNLDPFHRNGMKLAREKVLHFMGKKADDIREDMIRKFNPEELGTEEELGLVSMFRDPTFLSHNPETRIKPEINNAIELTHGPFSPEGFDIDLFKQYLDYLKERTILFHPKMGYNSYTPISSIHIHVSPAPAIPYMPRKNFEDHGPRTGVGNLATPFNEIIQGQGEKGQDTFRANSLLSSEHQTIEYRNILGTFDINKLMDNLNIAIAHTLKLLNIFGPTSDIRPGLDDLIPEELPPTFYEASAPMPSIDEVKELLRRAKEDKP